MLDWSKLKAFANEKINVTKKLKILFVKTLWEKEKMLVTKLKALTDDRINVTEKVKFALGRVENNLGKGENACYQYFLIFKRLFI